jgi:hypothetical protein
MTWEGILIIIMLAVIVFIVLGGMRIYWRMRADNGYNMGRNYMHDLGFSDEDIDRGQDDPDKELYVFRKAADKKKKQ